jgi:hypothetical protein
MSGKFFLESMFPLYNFYHYVKIEYSSSNWYRLKQHIYDPFELDKIKTGQFNFYVGNFSQNRLILN